MGLSNKDIKILWARAAGICSMTNCNKHLILESNATSNSTLIGENCHIVAEKKTGPRGESNLSLTERNNYQNLILLCRDHHKMIDDDTFTWTVEKLHEVKQNHEMWVNMNLNQNSDGLNEFYLNLANEVAQMLYVNRWDIISDNAVRTIVDEVLFDNMRDLIIRLETVAWPASNSLIKEAFLEVSNRLQLFIENYSSNSYLRENGFYVEDRRWKRTRHKQDVYKQYVNKSKEWFKTHYRCFRNLVVALNRLFSIIREHIDQLFQLNLGKLTIRDDLGVLGNGIE